MRAFLWVALLITPAIGAAQSRLGAIEGTWEACHRDAMANQRLRSDGAPELVRHLLHRHAVALDRCLAYADAPVTAYVEVVDLYRQVGQETRGLAVAERGLTLFAGNAELLLGAGSLLFKQGERERAVPMLEEALASRPNDAPAHALLGAYYYQAGSFALAHPHLQAVARNKPEDFEANAALGDVCLELHDQDCAARYLGHAFELRPHDGLLALKLGKLEQGLSHPDRALSFFASANDEMPGRFDVNLGLAQVLAQLGLHEEALAHFLVASAKQPDDAAAASGAAVSARALGRPKVALPLLDEALLSGTSIELAVQAALTWLAAGDPSRALDIAEKAPQAPQVDAVRGDAWLALGRPERALLAYQLAARADAWQYTLRVARALRVLGRYDDAAKKLERIGDESAARELVAIYLDQAKHAAEEGNLALARDCITRAGSIQRSPKVREAELALAEIPSPTPPDASPALATWLAFRRGARDEVVRLAEKYRDKSNVFALALLITSGELALAQRLGHQVLAPPEWQAYVDARYALDSLQRGRFADALLVSPRDTWLRSARVVAELASGAEIEAGELMTGLGSLARAAALVRSGVSEADAAVARLPESKSRAVLDARRKLERALAFMSTGDGRAARRSLQGASLDELGDAARFDAKVIAATDAAALAREMDGFSSLPEAVWNMAMAKEQASADGRLALPLLRELSGSAAPVLAERAKQLVSVKELLYRDL